MSLSEAVILYKKAVKWTMNIGLLIISPGSDPSSEAMVVIVINQWAPRTELKLGDFDIFNEEIMADIYFYQVIVLS